jgi:uncharacterized protein YuzE
VKIKYFEDTDTALLEFTERPVFETKEINENIYLDLDEAGNLIGMTIEHALSQANGHVGLPDSGNSTEIL